MTGLIIVMIRSNDFHSPRSFDYTSPILNLQVGQARQWGLLHVVPLNTLMLLLKRLNLMSSKCNRLTLHKIFNTNENHTNALDMLVVRISGVICTMFVQISGVIGTTVVRIASVALNTN